MRIWIIGLVGLLMLVLFCVLTFAENDNDPARTPHSTPKSPVRAEVPW